MVLEPQQMERGPEAGIPMKPIERLLTGPELIVYVTGISILSPGCRLTKRRGVQEFKAFQLPRWVCDESRA